MVPVSRLARLLLAVLAVPALTGCAALGLPEMPGAALVPLTTHTVDASLAPSDSGSPLGALGDVASPDGYSLSIPSGWVASDLSTTDGLALADALALVEPDLGALGRTALSDPRAPRLSLVAVDAVAAAAGTLAPAVIVATMRTRGMDKAAARTMVETLLAQAPLATDVIHSVEGLPAGTAHRYDATITGTIGDLQLEIRVFRVGGDSFVVAAVAPADQFAAAQPTFDAIIESLRFGV